MKINNTRQLQARKNQLNERRHQLEEKIEKDWGDIKDTSIKELVKAALQQAKNNLGSSLADMFLERIAGAFKRTKTTK